MFCPDCRIDKPCSVCDGDGVVCAGRIEPGPKDIDDVNSWKLIVNMVQFKRRNRLNELMLIAQRGDNVQMEAFIQEHCIRPAAERGERETVEEFVPLQPCFNNR